MKNSSLTAQSSTVTSAFLQRAAFVHGRGLRTAWRRAALITSPSGTWSHDHRASWMGVGGLFWRAQEKLFSIDYIHLVVKCPNATNFFHIQHALEMLQRQRDMNLVGLKAHMAEKIIEVRRHPRRPSSTSQETFSYSTIVLSQLRYMLQDFKKLQHLYV